MFNKKFDIKEDAWKKFMDEAIDPDSTTSNFRYDFKVLSKKYGQAYIEFCRAMWFANEGVMSKEEFMAFNGNMPEGFFNNLICK